MTDVSAAELIDRIERGDAPAIIDVRTRAEYDQGHVPGAVNVPFTSLLFGSPRVPVDPDQEVVVYCGHGPRARLAAAGLRIRGFTNLRYLIGHMRRWRREGLRQESRGTEVDLWKTPGT